ncbi:MAG: 30S ribosomal protein S17 [Deltaproteobacteria bacterium]|nr:30S ribosomal protein S17 [Deltaproteobacteria bacterium]
MEKRGERKTLAGKVVSDRMDKTVVVSVTRLARHPAYGKYVKRSVKYMAHDGKDECKTGDMVEIVECRPLSKLKRWRVSSVVEKAR